MIKIEVINAKGEVLASGAETLEYNKKYENGDKIKITLDGCKFAKLKLAKSLKESIVYIPGGEYVFDIPFDEHTAIYAPETWSEDNNIISAVPADESEIYAKRNIALNSAAQRYKTECYPYAKANFVTRDEPWFEERNSIDGVIEQSSHGGYPYQSYAGGAREDIDYTLYFGTNVTVDEIILYLRADFKDDHDTYWKSMTIEFSDGTKMPITLQKPTGGQSFKPEKPIVTDRIHLCDFKQAANPLSWAALTQIEVIGNINK